MKRLLFASAIACAPALAVAQPTPPTAPPQVEMVLIPRVTAEAAIQIMQSVVVLHPEVINQAIAQQAIGQFSACVADNPSGGVLTRNGPDQCPPVTAALSAQEDARKAAQAPAPAPVKHARP